MKQERENPVRDKSYLFALRIVKVYQYLSEKKYERVLSKQLLRSGTSIGANVREGINAQSKKEFIAKLNIALKEAHESDYWICLLRDGKYLTTEESSSLLKDCEELIRLLTSIIKTSRINLP
ncbi:MAG: four helix bundle protein [Candidatus Peregrinibacteria bacterium]